MRKQVHVMRIQVISSKLTNSVPVITRRMVIANGTCVSFCTFWPPLGTPWDNRGKCYMDGKRIQCWSNASQHVPISLQPFTSLRAVARYWSEIATFSYTLAFNAPVRGVPIGIPGKRLDLRKLESWGYQAVKTGQTSSLIAITCAVWLHDAR